MKNKRECYNQGIDCLAKAEEDIKRSYNPDEPDPDYWQRSFLEWIDIALNWAGLIEGAPE